MLRNCTQAGTRKTSPFSSSSAGCPGITRVWERNIIFYKVYRRLYRSWVAPQDVKPFVFLSCEVTVTPTGHFPIEATSMNIGVPLSWTDSLEWLSGASTVGGFLMEASFQLAISKSLLRRNYLPEVQMMKLLELIVLDLCTLMQLSIQMDRESQKKRKASSLRTQSSEKTALLYAHISTSYWSQCIPSCVAWLKKAVCFQSQSHGTKFPRKEMWRVKAGSSIHSFDAQIW